MHPSVFLKRRSDLMIWEKLIEIDSAEMPISEKPDHNGSEKLLNKVAIITGGGAGVGRAVATAFATEGADIVIPYLAEEMDVAETKRIIESKGRKCLTMAGDIGYSSFCDKVVNKTRQIFKKVDILVNNASEQHVQENFLEISNGQLENTFRTNIYSYFYMIKAVLPLLAKGSVIINTTSISAYRGCSNLIDFSATNGAIVSLTRSLAKNLIRRGIRVNGVALEPGWTQLIPDYYNPKQPQKVVNEAAGQTVEPWAIACCYLFLASEDSSYISGQILHSSGEIINF